VTEPWRWTRIAALLTLATFLLFLLRRGRLW